MKRIRIKNANVDICVTVDVKTIFLEKTSGDIAQEIERLDIARAIKHMGDLHEGPIARQIALAAKELCKQAGVDSKF